MITSSWITNRRGTSPLDIPGATADIPPPALDTKVAVAVDDDPSTLRLLEKLSQHLTGWRLDCVDSTDTVLDRLKQGHVHAVITDIEMPEVDGIDLFHHVRAVSPTTPVILMTSMPSVEAAVKCTRLGAANYLSKPLSQSGLNTALASLADWRPPTPTDSQLRRIQIAGYRLVRTIGEGNMGIVYEAQAADRRYAVKVLKANAGGQQDPEVARNRFLREARVLSEIHHPNIVPLVEFGTTADGQTQYLVMDFLDGEPLSEWIHERRSNCIATKTSMVRQIAEALSAIHHQRVLHRDIKPSNIMVKGDNKVTLMDFGIARCPESDLTLTQHVLGSPGYLSPEAYDMAKDIDHRSDFFSLGVLFYELLCWRRPFHAQTVIQLAHQICTTEAEDPRRHNPTIPPGLVQILNRLLAKSRDDRYDSALDIAAALGPYCG